MVVVALQWPPLAEFLQQSGLPSDYVDTGARALAHISRAALRWSGTDSERCDLAIVSGSLPEERRQFMTPLLNAKYAATLSGAETDGPTEGEIVLCTVDQLSVIDGGVHARDRPVHGLLDRDLVVLPDEILQAASERRVCLFNGPAGWLLMDKLNLAFMWEAADRGELSEDEARFVADHVPWTCRLKAGETSRGGRPIRELIAHVLERREDLILKPTGGWGGAGVTAGCEATAEAWESAVRSAAASDDDVWIVQECQESLTALLQNGEHGCESHRAVLGLFTFGETDGGMMVRVSPLDAGRVINTARGGTAIVPFLV